MYNKALYLLLLAMTFGLANCKQSDPVDPIDEEVGDLYFSGYYWDYKNANTPVGPGPNRFSGTSEFAWVDPQGNLHLKIAKKDNVWYCSEVISVKEFGYGTYVFTCISDFSDFNEKAVFGFFTWNSSSFQTQANSEVDVEFARWNNPSKTNLVTYSVQPVWFDNGAPYTERSHTPEIDINYIKQPTTHMFKWTPDIIEWESYEGTVFPGTNLLAQWSFDKNNRSRNKLEGGRTSNPIVIPAPETETNVRFNFWLLFGDAPTDNKEHEIIIKSFKFTPL